MRSHLLTMSRMSLAYACAYGFRPDVPQFPRPSGPEAQVGSLYHDLQECHVTGRNIERKDVDPVLLGKALDILNGPVKGWLDSRKWTACEVGLAYDAETDTCTAGPRRGQDGYDSCAPMVLRGTLDLVELHLADGIVDVIDTKTGKHVENRDQLYAQAVAASRYFGVKTARVAYAYPRKTKFDVPELETLDEDALDYQAGRIARVLRKLPMSEPERGDHCWRCEAREQCPAWVSTAA